MKRTVPTSVRWLLSAGLALCGLMLLAAPYVAAQNTVDVPPITIAAGKDATINVKTFCIEYGKPFPAQFPALGPNPIDPRVVQILRYAISKGYTESDPYQVQLAIWRQTTGQWKGTNRARAEEIFNNAAQAPAAPNPSAGSVALAQAVQANNIQLTADSWNALPAAPEQNSWSANAVLRLTNRGSNDVTITLPVGILVDAQGQEQDTVMYVSNIQAQPTNTPAPTATQAATATPVPATPRPAATQTMPRSGGSPADNAWLLTMFGAALVLAGVGLALYPAVRRRA